MSERFLTYQETLSLIAEFLECAIHKIVCMRRVYPRELFEERSKYGLKVQQARPPALKEYIGNIIQSIREELVKASLRKVFVVIREEGADETPLEQFTFHLEWLIPKREANLDGGDWIPDLNGLKEIDVKDLMRKLVMRLDASADYLDQDLPKDSDLTFAVVCEMVEEANPPESKAAQRGDIEAEWFPVEQFHSELVPVSTARFGMIQLAFNAEKFDRPTNSS